jgi:type IV secretory pathway VirB10-like protein
MEKTKVAKYSKLTIIYFVGVVVIVYGLYSFLTGAEPETTSNSFYLMFSGLVVATAGSIYGHNKIAGPGYQSQQKDGKKDKDEKMPAKEVKAVAKMEKKMKDKRLEEIKKLEEEEKKRLEELKREEEKELKRIEEERKREEKRRQEELKKAQKTKDEPAKAVEAAASAPSGGVVKIMVCPSCGEENKYTAKFCDNCGKKLRP